MNNCYYEVLGIPPSADLEVIRTAYRSLAQRFHPDKNSDFNAATATMQKLNEAYRVLSNAKKRKEYDDSRRRERHFDPDNVASEPVQTRWANERCNPPSLDDIIFIVVSFLFVMVFLRGIILPLLGLGALVFVGYLLGLGVSFVRQLFGFTEEEEHIWIRPEMGRRPIWKECVFMAIYMPLIYGVPALFGYCYRLFV